jgi:formate C-acetyltransferase
MNAAASQIPEPSAPVRRGTTGGPTRPCRLSPRTRELAELALDGAWGRSLSELSVTVPAKGAEPGLSEERRYARCIRLIAEHAPLRILPGQLVAGAATLRRAAFHVVPVCTPDGKPAFQSVSHTTLGFDRALRLGYCGLRQEIEARLGASSNSVAAAAGRGPRPPAFAKATAGRPVAATGASQPALDEKGADLLAAMLECLDAAATWHRRHLELLDALIAESAGEAQVGYRRVRDALANVPENPPHSFREAVQALWFLFCFQRLCGNWPGIGRVDEMLGPFLQADLASGAITRDEARELLAHFWINGCDWVGASQEPGSGDGQHYQNVVLAGIDPSGREVLNDVTGLILDVVEELGISDFPIAVRISPRTPEALLRRIAEVQRFGAGTVAIYNEDQIIRSLTAFGYPLAEARAFANDGCWEIIIPGKTCFGYKPFDVLAILQRVLGVTTEAPPATCADFETLYAAFRTALEAKIAELDGQAEKWATGATPAALVSLLVEGCVAKGRGYYERGARYTVLAPHAGGLQDAANSLLAIRRIVYEEQRVTLPQLVEALRADWREHEPLRRLVRTGIDFYGNDAPEADALVRRVFDDFLAAAARMRRDHGVLQPPGISTFGRQLAWLNDRKATAAGARNGETLAMNASPAPGTDRLGPTAVIKSHGSLGLERLTNGTALELKLHPASVQGENGIVSMVGLMRAFIRLGGIFLQTDVVDSDLLRDAQAHPERYPHLAVRISGWSARFATLNREWQEMIIRRTEQH